MKFKAIITARKYQSDVHETVWEGNLWDTEEQAEDEGYENRAHPKEIVKVISLGE